MVIQMFTELGRKISEHSENFKQTENIRKYQREVTKLKKTVTDLKKEKETKLEGFNSRLD